MNINDILAKVDPLACSMLLVVNDDQTFELYSRYSSTDSALLLMKAQETLMRRADEPEGPTASPEEAEEPGL